MISMLVCSSHASQGCWTKGAKKFVWGKRTKRPPEESENTSVLCRPLLIFYWLPTQLELGIIGVLSRDSTSTQTGHLIRWFLVGFITCIAVLAGIGLSACGVSGLKMIEKSVPGCCKTCQVYNHEST